MDIKFVCPRANEVLTEQACEKNYEYEACRGCTSQQTAARKALFDMLKKEYNDRAEFAMREDGVLITVRDELSILADPGDWRDTYVGIDCGKYGETHTHPQDVFQWVKEFFAGRIFILLNEDDLCSATLYISQAACWEGWNEWKWSVDVFGVHPAEEYAVAKGFVRKKSN